jgi:LysM repeat protein
VVQGDTLWDIAKRNGMTVDGLLALNPGIRNPNLITVGQKVRLQ